MFDEGLQPKHHHPLGQPGNGIDPMHYYAIDGSWTPLNLTILTLYTLFSYYPPLFSQKGPYAMTSPPF